MPDILRLANVSAGYGATIILEDVAFGLSHGAALAVLGRNGMGKTTLLRAISAREISVPKTIRVLHVEQEATGDDRYRPSQWLRRRALLGLPAATAA